MNSSIVVSSKTIEGATLVASNFIETHQVTVKYTAGYWWAIIKGNK